MKQDCIIGGDIRQRWLAEYLAEAGHSVFVYGFEQCLTLSQPMRADFPLSPAGRYLLPIPVTKNGTDLYAPYSARSLSLSQITDMIPNGSTVYGGQIPEEMKIRLENKNCQVSDYGLTEDFKKENALPSAEGAIVTAAARIKSTVKGSRFCVIGYGCIGKELVRLLVAWGGIVTATARKEKDLNAIRAAGATAVATANIAECGGFDVILNTVPAPVFGKEACARCEKGTLLMELASAPGGIDKSAAEACGLTLITARGIPAAYAPKAAAKAILRQIEAKVVNPI